MPLTFMAIQKMMALGDFRWMDIIWQLTFWCRDTLIKYLKEKGYTAEEFLSGKA